MLTIRLRRSGAKKDPHFRVVVADSRAGRDGPFIEILGHYHPRRDPAEFTVDRERVDSWVAKGAQLSDTVRTLVRQLEAGKIRQPEPPTRPVPEADESEEVAASSEEGVQGAGSETDAGDAAEAAPEASTEEAATAEESASEPEETDEEKDE